MSKKNFVSYGDAETLMTEISSKIKSQNTQYIDAIGRNLTGKRNLLAVNSPYRGMISFNPPSNSTQIYNIHTPSSGDIGNAISSLQPAVIINSQQNGSGSILVNGTSSVVSVKTDYGNKVETTGSGCLVHGHAANGDIIVKDGSYAGGDDLKATGNCSHAEGKFNRALGDHSHVEGFQNNDDQKSWASHIEGVSNSYLTNGADRSWAPRATHIEGDHNWLVFNGGFSDTARAIDRFVAGVHIEGKSTSITRSNNVDVSISGSHVEGHQCAIVDSVGSHVEGFKSSVKQTGSNFEPIITNRSNRRGYLGEGVSYRGYGHAEGVHTRNFGHGSHTEGVDTIVRSCFGTNTSGCHAEGIGSSAGGYGSHAEGCQTRAQQTASHAEGSNTHAIANYSHTEGYGTSAQHHGAHAEGKNTIAKGIGSHSGGDGGEFNCIIASGQASFAHGYARSDGDSAISEWGRIYAHAGCFAAGIANPSNVSNDSRTLSAEGNGSIALGVNVRSLSDGNCALGRYNAHSTSQTTHILTVGKGSSSARANAFRVAATATYGAGAYNSSGADYAEMFEWADGNQNNEDRRGLFVVIEGAKIRLANDNDDLEDVLGIVSADPSVCGDVHDDQWKGMYLRDIFGAPILEEFEERFWTGEKDEEGDKIYETRIQTRQKLNPEYDVNTKYIPRSERPEWSAVGMLGKLVMVSDVTVNSGDYVTPDSDGKATKSQTRTRFYCMERLDDTHIRVLIR